MIKNPNRSECGANIELIELAVDDSWCRDSGPSFVCHPQHGLAGLSWRFNAWGGKSQHSLDRSLGRRILDQLGLDGFSTALCNEGGAIHVDGEGTLITTESVLLNPNRNPGVSKADFEACFARHLGIRKTIWLPGDPQYEASAAVDPNAEVFCASYTNFYIANGAIIMPAYGIAADQDAAAQLAHAFPGREIVPVRIDHIAHGGGGIHCITQQQPQVQP